MPTDWEIVTRADGTVLTVDGGAPDHWRDTRLQTSTEVPAELRHAASTLLRELHDSGRPLNMATVTLPMTQQTIRVIAIQAVPLERAPTDLRTLLESTFGVLRSQAVAADVALDTVIDRNLPPLLWLDPHKIAWTAATLIGNALRYVRPGSRRTAGGTITVRVTFDQATAEVTIAVHDEGPGMPEARVQSLFRPDPHQVGSRGLGLLMVQDVITAHGGQVEVESSTAPVGHGTTIRVRFPVGTS